MDKLVTTRNYFIGLMYVLVGAGLLTVAAIVGLTIVGIFSVLAVIAYVYFGMMYSFKKGIRLIKR